MLAIIESPDLDRSRAESLAAVTKARIAEGNYKREKELLAKGISSEREACVLGFSATIPIVISVLAWRYVAPPVALDGAVRAVIAGTFVGTLTGYGVANIAALAMRRLRSPP